MKKEGKMKLLHNDFKHQFANSGIKIQMYWERESECSLILRGQGKVEDNRC